MSFLRPHTTLFFFFLGATISGLCILFPSRITVGTFVGAGGTNFHRISCVARDKSLTGPPILLHANVNIYTSFFFRLYTPSLGICRFKVEEKRREKSYVIDSVEHTLPRCCVGQHQLLLETHATCERGIVHETSFRL